MYRYLVRQKVRQVWSNLNADHVSVLDTLARPFSYTFVGLDHPLAGTRVTEGTMREQLERVERIFPGIRFSLRDVLVKGWPWKTVVGAQVDVEAPLADGSTYRNELFQVAHLRWGKANHVTTTIDLGRLLPAYDRQAAAGVEGARLAPLVG
jgi:ketosteroid isomerase-like protein